MPSMRNPLSMLRRWGGQREATPGAVGRSASSDADRTAGDGSSPSGSRRRSSSSRRPSGGDFGFTVPEGTRPGQSMRVQGPDGRQVEVKLPEGSRPGQKIRVQLDGVDTSYKESGGSSPSGGSIRDLVEFVRSTVDGTRSSIRSMRERLTDELELQKALWASAGSSTVVSGSQSLAVTTASNIDLSQTQALVCAAAEIGDCHQLLAALAEARKFSTVSMSLEEAVKALSSAEEALVTWQCLLDALEAKDGQEIEVWLEQCKGLGLEVPASMKDALKEACKREEESNTHFERCREVHQKLKFALEVDDPELLAEVVREARLASLSELPAAKEAAARQAFHARARASADERSRNTSSARRGRSGSGNGGSADAGAGPAGRRNYEPDAEDDIWSRAPPEPPWSQRSANETSSPQRQPSAYSNTQAEFDSDPRSVRELMEECRRRCLDVAGCTDRRDLLELLRKAKPPESGGGGGSTSSRAQDGTSRSSPRASPTPPRQNASYSFGGDASSGAGNGGASFGGSRSGGAGAARTAAEEARIAAESARAATFSQAPSTQTKMGATVWERRNVPAYLVSKRSQALWLLGLDGGYMTRLSSTDLRSAYRRAAMESHPDKLQNHNRQEEAKELFQRVKAAYDYLLTPAAGCVY